MIYLFYFFIFLFGLCVGSFLNVLIIRLGSGVKETIGGRSYCPKCKHQLGWRDLVPVLSFLILRGRCRYCKKPISIQYPLVEITTGLLFLLISNFQFPISQFSNIPISSIYFLFLVSCLIVIFVSDLKFFIIPDEIIIAGIVGTVLYKLFGVLNFNNWNLFGIWDLGFGIWRPLLSALLSAAGASVFFLFIVLITRGRGMGLGDVKLAFLMGLALGWPNILVALFLAFFFGAFVGLSLVIFSRAKFNPAPGEVWGMKSELPFGTFLSAATFVSMLWGQNVADWYLNWFF